MPKISNELSVIGIAQQLRQELWNNGKPLSAAESAAIEAAQKGDAKLLTDCIVARLNAVGYTVAECYGIIHDQDKRLAWSAAEKKEIPTQKEIHGHWVIKFAPGKGGMLESLATAIGIESQYLEKAKKGRYAYDNMLSYLVHVKYPDKLQYPIHNVYTAAGKNYEDYAKEHWSAWLKARGSVQKRKAVDGIDDLEYKILAGEVTKEQVLLTDDYYAIYARNKRRCDDAFNTYGQRKAYQSLQAMQNGEFSLAVFFITGPAGAGKTRFTKTFIRSLQEESVLRFGAENRWYVCQTAASNPFDEYSGEEILFMDDVRGWALCAEDWLKLMDPYNAGPGSARYHNKVMACRTVIITSTKEPLEFFYYCKMGGGDRSEAMDQFLRRIMSLVRVIPYQPSDPRFAIFDSEMDNEPHDEKLPWLASQYGTPGLSLRTRFRAYEPHGPNEIFDLNTASRILVDKVMSAHGFDCAAERLAEQFAEIEAQLTQSVMADAKEK